MSMNEMPVIGPKSAAELQSFIDHPEPPPAEVTWIRKQIGLLSQKPSRRMGTLDAEMIVETFERLLKGYSRADLGYAFGQIMRKSKWFPDVADVIEYADYSVTQRSTKRVRAKMLIMKHERDWTPPIPEDQIIKPEEVQALLAEMKLAGEKVVGR